MCPVYGLFLNSLSILKMLSVPSIMPTFSFFHKCRGNYIVILALVIVVAVWLFDSDAKDLSLLSYLIYLIG